MKSAVFNENGGVMMTAMLLIAVMLGVGLAAMSTVDTQSEQSRSERVGESTFNLTEAALTTRSSSSGARERERVQALSGSLPYRGERFLPRSDAGCPELPQSTQPDYSPRETDWYTWVRDNAGRAGSLTPDTFWRRTPAHPRGATTKCRQAHVGSGAG